MSRNITILHADDDISNLENFQGFVETAARKLELTVQTSILETAEGFAIRNKPEGIELAQVASGLLAEDIIREAKFDVIITDLHFPGEQDKWTGEASGWRVARIASNRRFQPWAKVVIASGTETPSQKPPEGVILMDKRDAYDYVLEKLLPAIISS